MTTPAPILSIGNPSRGGVALSRLLGFLTRPA